jgi:hypothetical protein
MRACLSARSATLCDGQVDLVERVLLASRARPGGFRGVASGLEILLPRRIRPGHGLVSLADLSPPSPAAARLYTAEPRVLRRIKSGVLAVAYHRQPHVSSPSRRADDSAGCARVATPGAGGTRYEEEGQCESTC